MATPIIMPRQGQSVESCIIGKWHKKKGDTITAGDILFTYETDKSTFDEEAKIDGILLDVFFEEGDDVPCLTNVCVIGEAGESTKEFDPRGKKEEEPAQAKDNSGVEKTASTQVDVPIAQTAAVENVPAVAADRDFVRISPRAKNLANRAGVDILSTAGTGPEGRIIERDIKDALASGRAATPAAAADAAYQGQGAQLVGSGIGGRIRTQDIAAISAAGAVGGVSEAEYEEVINPTIRKTIAKAMHSSLSNMAQLTLNSSFDMTAINSFRKGAKAAADTLSLPNITINDIILYAVSRTILNHPYCNAHYYDDKTLLYKSVNLGVAVDTPRGLIVPTLFGAEKMSLSEISFATKAIGEASKSGTISPDSLRGGTFTVTNLGTLGVESFTPVINPPQTCILGVNTIETKVRVLDGQIQTYPAMTLSLTFDHRAIDGAPAARFLKELVSNLENFTALLAL